ncbi:hypothetical protein VTK26DRAFT_2747 [Humicola hyalothermophila]
MNELGGGRTAHDSKTRCTQYSYARSTTTFALLAWCLVGLLRRRTALWQSFVPAKDSEFLRICSAVDTS